MSDEPGKTQESVEVLYWANGMGTDRFVCSSSSVDLFDGGRALVRLVDGRDGQGPVKTVQYRRAERIIRRSTGIEMDKPEVTV